MTKAELIERYGEAWYEEQKERSKERSKVYYNNKYANDPEYREREKERTRVRYANDPEYRECHKEYYNKLEVKEHRKEYMKDYRTKDLTINSKSKNTIRCQSSYILFKQRQHTKLKDYEIHHCFGYEDPSKFIYIPKSLHSKIHQYLRDNNIDADSNHYDYIKYMINECEEYTYISI